MSFWNGFKSGMFFGFVNNFVGNIGMCGYFGYGNGNCGSYMQPWSNIPFVTSSYSYPDYFGVNVDTGGYSFYQNQKYYSLRVDFNSSIFSQKTYQSSFMPNVSFYQQNNFSIIPGISFIHNNGKSAAVSVLPLSGSPVLGVSDGTENVNEGLQSDVSVTASELKEKWIRFMGANKLAHLPDEFYQKVIEISEEIQCNPDDLMAVMNIETIGSFRANKRNNGTKATGLIQFMPNTAISMGTHIDTLASMTEVQQLEYVKRYLIDRKRERGVTGQLDGTTLYSLVFWPAAAKKDNTYIIARHGSRVFSSNPALNVNGDNIITRNELGQVVAMHKPA